MICENDSAAEEDSIDQPQSDIDEEPPPPEAAGDAPSWEDDGGDAGSEAR